MSSPPRPPRRGLLAGLRASFLTGLVFVAPAVLTIWLISAMIDFVDARVLPLIPEGVIAQYLPDAVADWRLADVPGLGVIIFVVFTLLVGWLAKGYIGRSLIKWGEDIVARMPVVRSIYNGLKQIVETVFSTSANSFSRACLVEFPRPGCWAVAFVSTDAKGEMAQKIGQTEKMIAVFMPTTPNPTTGFLFVVPEASVIYLDMSIEDAAKFIISAGLVVPDPDKPGQIKAL